MSLQKLLLASAACIGLTISFGAQATPSPSHVVIVMLENHDFTQFVGAANAPFINNTLIPQGLVYTNSHGVEHPSQPNYLDFFSGSNQGVNNNNATASNSYNFPAIYAFLQNQISLYQAALNAGTAGFTAAGLQALQAKAAQVQPFVVFGTLATGDAFPVPKNFNIPAGVPFTTPNLASVLTQAGKTFTEYSEGLIAAGAADSNGYANPAVLNNSADPLQVGYAHRHDPVADWISTTPTGNQLPVSADQDFSLFPTDFSLLPSVALVVPNTINDGHDGTNAAGVSAADTWLANNMANYLAWAKLNNSLLVVTTDENDFSSGNHILTVVDGDPSLFQQGGNGNYVDHFTLLATLESMNGAACTGAACASSGFSLTTDGSQLAVPEPSALAALTGAMGVLGFARRRRSNAN